METTEFIEKGIFNTTTGKFYCVIVEENEDDYLDFKVDRENETIHIIGTTLELEPEHYEMLWEKVEDYQDKLNFEHPGLAGGLYSNSY